MTKRAAPEGAAHPRQSRREPKAMSINKKPLAMLSIIAIAATASFAARADDDFVVYSPYVTQGQSEVEMRGHQTTDSDPTQQGERAYEVSVSHTFMDWWKPEIYVGAYERAPGQANSLDGYEFENTFQLTDEGEYWADFGFLASYEYKSQPGVTSRLEFGPLIEKRSDRVDQRLNFVWEKELGGGADRKYEFRTTYAVSYEIRQWLAPGFETYYRPADDSRQIGPALYGEIPSSRGNEFEYSFALVYGTNKGAPNRTFVMRLEYEFN